MTAKIKQHMRNLLRDGECIDRDTGLADCTRLAETTAHDLGHHEWLDDECHEVWDIAVDTSNEMGFGE